jgi:hypothetical protein
MNRFKDLIIKLIKAAPSFKAVWVNLIIPHSTNTKATLYSSIMSPGGLGLQTIRLAG